MESLLAYAILNTTTTTKGTTTMASINVKVQTVKLIEGLEKALGDREKLIAQYEKDKKKYDEDYKKAEQSIISLATKGKLELTQSNIGKEWRTEKVTVTLTYNAGEVKFPEEPSREWAAEREVEEIRNALSILKMSDSETVNASTYKGVARYL